MIQKLNGKCKEHFRALEVDVNPWHEAEPQGDTD